MNTRHALTFPEAIVFTLHYADCFDSSLTLDEIWGHLPLKISKETLNQYLDELIKSGEVEFQNEHYFLSGRGGLPELKSQFGDVSDAKLARAKSLSSLISKLPWVHEIGVSGSVANKTAKESDDIDLVIVTSSKRLWFTRLIIVIYLKLTRQYRGKVVKDKFCPNVWLSLENLEFENRSYYLAREIASVKVLYPQGGSSVIEKANPWISLYLPQIPHIGRRGSDGEDLPPPHSGQRPSGSWTSSGGAGRPFPPPSPFTATHGWVRLGFQNFNLIFNYFDQLSFSFQKMLIKRHLTRELVTVNRALFHPVNYEDVLKDKIDKKMHPKYREILVDSKFWS